MDEGISMGLLIGLLSDMLPEVDPSVIESYVNAWLTAHPEATTTVQDGSITLAKLASDLAAKINSISSLSDEIDDIGSDVTDLKSALNGNDLPWELGGVTTSGLNNDDTRGRTALTIRTHLPITISTTSYIVTYVYGFDGSYIPGESNISWAKTARTIKKDRLFRVAVKKDDNSAISTNDLNTLASGITFSVGANSKEIFFASQDKNGNQYPTLKNSIEHQVNNASFDGEFALSLITLLKDLVYTSGNAVTLLSNLASAMKQTVETVTNFESRMSFRNTAANFGYIGSSGYRITTQKRYFDLSTAYTYIIKVSAHTSSKVWVRICLINQTAVTAMKNGEDYSYSDFRELDYAEVADGQISFNPSLYTINSLPPVAFRIAFGFGDSYSDEVSLIGTELESFDIQRVVNVNE